MPVKNKIGRDRLDKYYHLAKEHGYRSRSAFKIIQLSRKHNFFQNCNVLVDLCAAPGGWLQVASKQLPVNSTIIGVDLVPIKPIKGVITYQCDIRTARCKNLIQKHVKGSAVDVVLHDGSPNMGCNWNLDAFNQNLLVLEAAKLAASLLKRGGTFVTKIFRSADYNSLLWMLQKCFSRLKVTKPQSSRSASAEIFAICIGFKSLKEIDPKIFLCEVTLASQATKAQPDNQLDRNLPGDQLDRNLPGKNQPGRDQPGNELAGSIKGKSLGQIMKERIKGKRQRGGYEEGDDYRECSVLDYIYSDNPIECIVLYNRIVFKPRPAVRAISSGNSPISDDGVIERILASKHTNEEVKTLCDDLKVAGKSDLMYLLKWRQRICRSVIRAIGGDQDPGKHADTGNVAYQDPGKHADTGNVVDQDPGKHADPGNVANKDTYKGANQDTYKDSNQDPGNVANKDTYKGADQDIYKGADKDICKDSNQADPTDQQEETSKELQELQELEERLSKEEKAERRRRERKQRRLMMRRGRAKTGTFENLNFDPELFHGGSSSPIGRATSPLGRANQLVGEQVNQPTEQVNQLAGERSEGSELEDTHNDISDLGELEDTQSDITDPEDTQSDNSDPTDQTDPEIDSKTRRMDVDMQVLYSLRKLDQEEKNKRKKASKKTRREKVMEERGLELVKVLDDVRYQDSLRRDQEESDQSDEERQDLINQERWFDQDIFKEIEIAEDSPKHVGESNRADLGKGVNGLDLEQADLGKGVNGLDLDQENVNQQDFDKQDLDQSDVNSADVNISEEERAAFAALGPLLLKKKAQNGTDRQQF